MYNNANFLLSRWIHAVDLVVWLAEIFVWFSEYGYCILLIFHMYIYCSASLNLIPALRKLSLGNKGIVWVRIFDSHVITVSLLSNELNNWCWCKLQKAHSLDDKDHMWTKGSLYGQWNQSRWSRKPWRYPWVFSGVRGGFDLVRPPLLCCQKNQVLPNMQDRRFFA